MTLVARLSVASHTNYIIEKFVLTEDLFGLHPISIVNVNRADIKVQISMKLSMHIMPLDIPCINFGAFNFLHKAYQHDCHTDLRDATPLALLNCSVSGFVLH